MVNRARIETLSSWMMSGAQPARSFQKIVQDCGERLIEAGVPIEFLAVAGRYAHPTISGWLIGWTRRRGTFDRTFPREYFTAEDYADTPYGIVESSRRMLRYRTGHEGPRHAFIDNFFSKGITDVVFLPLAGMDDSLTGIAEFGTRDPDGFDDEMLRALRRIQAPLSRLREAFIHASEKRILLGTYLGSDSSRRVLDGQVRLGDGNTISAVVVFADLADFTRLSNELPSGDVLALLNRFFTAFHAAVRRHDGEILKFLGDGVLAIFHAPDDLTAQEVAAAAALEAVSDCRRALHEEDGETVQFRAALHVGDVFYGNVGSDTRLDFTAIGPTVNLVSRMLTEAARQSALTICSEDFDTIAKTPGGERLECAFKGFSGSQTLYILERDA